MKKVISYQLSVISRQLSVLSRQLSVKLFVLAFTVHCSLFIGHCFSQVGINTTGATPNSSAMLDVISTTKGMLIPRMTLSQRNQLIGTNGTAGTLPALSCLIYQTDGTSGYYYHDGSGWVRLFSGTAVTSVSGTAPIVSSGGTTPVISIPVATGSTNGYLSSGDWTTFYNGAALANNITDNSYNWNVTYQNRIISASGTAPLFLQYIPNQLTGSIAAATPSAAGSMSASDKTKLDAITGSNTGDETVTTIKTKLGITTLSGSNTGDQTLAGLGGVSGSGTSGYLARWNGTSSHNNSVIYDNGTNVGIGTTVPRGPLHVAASTYSYIQSTWGNNGTVFGSADPIPIETGLGFAGYSGLGIIPNKWGNATPTVDAHTALYIAGSQRNNGAAVATIVFGNWGYFTNTGIGAGGLGSGPDKINAVKFKIVLFDGGSEFVQNLNFYSRNGNGTDANPISIASSGCVGINGAPNASYSLYSNGAAGGTTAWTNTSDIRFKKNIVPLQNSLNKVLALQGVSFEWNQKDYPDKNFVSGKQIGFIAQDVEKVIPAIVTTDTKGYKGIAYATLVAVLTEAIKSQQGMIDSLKLVTRQHSTAIGKLQEENRTIKTQNASFSTKFESQQVEIEKIKLQLGVEANK